MLEFASERKSMAGWVPSSLSQHHDLQKSISQHVALGSTVGQIQQALENAMHQVDKERNSQACEPMTDAEKHLDIALRELQLSVSVQSLNVSSLVKKRVPMNPWSMRSFGA